MNLTFDILDYKEHALSKGPSSRAVSYVKIIDCRKKNQWGVGLHDDIIASSVQALFSAINRAVAQQMCIRDRERIELALISYEQSPCKDQLVYTDLTRLREVIGNIVDNAMKYGDGKWTHVSFYEEDHHSILKLENSGSYIEQSDAGAIFQSFYRGNNVNSHAGNGLGLDVYKRQVYQCLEYKTIML